MKIISSETVDEDITDEYRKVSMSDVLIFKKLIKLNIYNEVTWY